MKKVRAPLNESLNTLRRLAGLNEQVSAPLSSLLTRYGNNEAGIIAYDDENGDEGDCERSFSELVSSYSVDVNEPIQASATTTVSNLVADVDKVAQAMGFDGGAFNDTASFWQTDWLPGHQGQLLVVGVGGEHEDLGPVTNIFCIKI